MITTPPLFWHLLAIALNLSLVVPQMWHKTLFDKLRASAYWWKGTVLWPSQYPKMHFCLGLCPGPRWEVYDATQTPSRLGRRHPFSYPIPIVPFGASILPPLALVTRRLWRLVFWRGGHCPTRMSLTKLLPSSLLTQSKTATMAVSGRIALKTFDLHWPWTLSRPLRPSSSPDAVRTWW